MDIKELNKSKKKIEKNCGSDISAKMAFNVSVLIYRGYQLFNNSNVASSSL